MLLELESGTYRLAWTQSVTRRRWLAVKLGLTALAAVLAALAMTAARDLVARRRSTSSTGAWRTSSTSRAPSASATCCSRSALPLAIGAVWRRTVPALVAGFAGYIVARVFVQNWLRERYETPLTATWPASSGPQRPQLDKAWIIELGPSDRLGNALAPPLNPVGVCQRAARASGRDPSCLPDDLYIHAVYHPASRFWLFQGIETALFGGVAVALIAFAAWWIHERLDVRPGYSAARISAGAPKPCSTSGIGDAAVALLVRLEHGDERARRRDGGAVERVQVAHALLAAVARVEPARLVVGGVRARRELAVAALARQPGLDVVLLGGRARRGRPPRCS